MAETTIEWATHVWNPFTGCDRISPGCANCYALTSAASLQRRERGRIAKAEREGKSRPTVRYQRDGERRSSGPGFGFTVHWDKLAHFNFPAGARVFVNSMSDVFHEEAPVEAIAQLWAAFASKPAVRWLVLTKRPERMLEVLGRGFRSSEWSRGWMSTPTARSALKADWPLPNVWLGVTIENRRFVHRADLLRQTPAAVRFISAEPLLGPLVADAPGGQWRDGYRGLQLDLTDIDWLITGGESGPKHRPFDPAWASDLRGECQAEGVAFFHKQNGGRTAKEGGRELDGRTWDEFPEPRAAAA